MVLIESLLQNSITLTNHMIPFHEPLIESLTKHKSFFTNSWEDAAASLRCVLAVLKLTTLSPFPIWCMQSMLVESGSLLSWT
jgi:hypothetical protein